MRRAVLRFIWYFYYYGYIYFCWELYLSEIWMFILTCFVSRAFMTGAASQAGDADSSRAPGITSGLHGSVNVHRGALLLVPQWQCISSFVFYIETYGFKTFSFNGLCCGLVGIFLHLQMIPFRSFRLFINSPQSCNYQEKKEEIWLSTITKAPTPIEMSKGQRDDTTTPQKSSITQRLRTDLGRSVRVTTATQLVWLTRFTGPTLSPTATAV